MIDDRWQPTSLDEQCKRAYFFLHLLGAHCLTHLEDFLSRSSHGDTISVPDLLRAVKVIVSTSCYLAVLESSSGPPSGWVLDWLVQVLAQLDELLDDPPASELTEAFVLMDHEFIIEKTGTGICQMMKLRRTYDQNMLVVHIHEQKDYRKEVLEMALSHPMDSLQNHVMLFG